MSGTTALKLELDRCGCGGSDDGVTLDGRTQVQYVCSKRANWAWEGAASSGVVWPVDEEWGQWADMEGREDRVAVTASILLVCDVFC